MESVMPDRGDSVRAAWLEQVIREFQHAISLSLVGDRDQVCALISDSTSAIPKPNTAVEHLLLRTLALEFAWRFGRTFHDQFHGGSGPPCSFLPADVL